MNKISGSDSSSTGEEERLRHLFLSCDSNNDGRLDCGDLYDMCRKLNMAELAEEIINTLGANIKGSISFDEFLSCREKVFQQQTETSCIGTQKLNSVVGAPISKNMGNLNSTNVSNFQNKGQHNWRPPKECGNNFGDFSGHFLASKRRDVYVDSSASENSVINSGAEYDSGAQDLCGEPQSLHMLMQREHPDLYDSVFALVIADGGGGDKDTTGISSGSHRRNSLKPDNDINSSSASEKNCNNNNSTGDGVGNGNSHSNSNNLSVDTSISQVQKYDTNMDLSQNNVKHLFDLANALHLERTTRLRSEIRDLSYRLKGLQASRDANFRDNQRLQRERDQLRNEMSNQIARYEDRLTELHSVIAELRRRLEHSESNVIHEVDEVDDENDDDGDDNDDDADNNTEKDKISSKNLKSDRHSKSKLKTVIPISESHIQSHAADRKSLKFPCDPIKPSSDRDDTSVASSEGGSQTSVGATDGDHLELNALEKYGEIGRKCQDSSLNSTNLLIQSSMNRIQDPSSHFIPKAPYYQASFPTDVSNGSGTSHPNRDGEKMQSDFKATIIDLQQRLARISEERDRLAQKLSEKSLLVMSADSTMGCDTSLLQTGSGTRPVMGLTRHITANKSVVSTQPSQQQQQQQQQQTGITMTATNRMRSSDDKFAENMEQLQPSSDLNLSFQPNTTNESNPSNGNVYDIPEPDWLSWTLRRYYDYVTNKNQTFATNATSESNSSSIGQMDHLILPDSLDRPNELINEQNPELEHTSSVYGPRFSPHAVLIFLTGLAKVSPYSRLSEVAQCAQLTWQHLLATLARYRSDCLVLQANLSEIKANIDQMQCQLNQTEANRYNMIRTIQSADAALEVGDCLNQLYSTELAMVLYRQTHKALMSKQVFSTLSSSTSSSSFPGRSKANQDPPPPPAVSNNSALVPTNQQNQGRNLLTNSNNHPSTPSPNPQYAVYMVRSSTDSDSQPNAQQTTPLTINLRTLKSLRQHAELFAQSILDRCEPSESAYERVGSSVNVPNPSYPRDAYLHGHNQAPVSPGSFSVQSSMGPAPQSSNSLVDSSVYANSWYVSLGRNGQTMDTNDPCLNNFTSSNPSINPVRVTTSANNPHLGPPIRQSSRGGFPPPPPPPLHHSNTLPGTGSNNSGGWQTPDSGAGSSSINEVSQQQILVNASMPHCYQIYGNSLNGQYGGGPLYQQSSTLLDSFPPIWSVLPNGNTSVYDSDLDSSDSSEALAILKPIERQLTKPLVQNPIHISNWSRLEERKLRNRYNQLVIHFKRLKSTIPDSLNWADLLSNEENWADSHLVGSSDPVRMGSGQRIGSGNLMDPLQSNLPLTGSLRRIPLAVFLENSVLLQELCCVKEECADLKVRVYLLEKELHANRLTLSSRNAAENALRAHLNALLTETNSRRSNEQQQQQSYPQSQHELALDTTTNPNETRLLRDQVKNLLHALEALRSSTELQQSQSEELVDDLKRANAALIAAFEKAKRKYLARIKKLEEQISETTNSASSHTKMSNNSCPPSQTSSPAHVNKTAPTMQTTNLPQNSYPASQIPLSRGGYMSDRPVNMNHPISSTPLFSNSTAPVPTDGSIGPPPYTHGQCLPPDGHIIPNLVRSVQSNYTQLAPYMLPQSCKPRPTMMSQHLRPNLPQSQCDPSHFPNPQRCQTDNQPPKIVQQRAA